jgi:Family of unknown function (DUF5989)
MTVSQLTNRPEGLVRSFSEEADQQSAGLTRELFDLLRQNKKWWLMPVVATLMVVGVVVVLGGTAVAPFIYTLF